MSGDRGDGPSRADDEDALEDDLLALLDPDPVEAAEQLLLLRGQLERFLAWDCRDADDAAQEVFVRGLRRIREGANMDKGARAYFFGIARNLIKEEWKPKRRREQQLDPPSWEARVSPSRDVQGTEAGIELEQYLSRLNEFDRTLILRYAVEGPGSVARDLGFTKENVRVKAFRIRERLRVLRDGETEQTTRSEKPRRKQTKPSRHGRETREAGEEGEM